VQKVVVVGVGGYSGKQAMAADEQKEQRVQSKRRNGERERAESVERDGAANGGHGSAKPAAAALDSPNSNRLAKPTAPNLASERERERKVGELQQQSKEEGSEGGCSELVIDAHAHAERLAGVRICNFFFVFCVNEKLQCQVCVHFVYSSKRERTKFCCENNAAKIHVQCGESICEIAC
jgi:hypothetical protein